MKATATQTNTFLYDGWNLIHEEMEAATPASRSYVWGLDLSQSLQGVGGVGGLLCQIQGRDGSLSRPFFSFSDANGNITDLVDTNGAVVAHYEYDPYGNTIARSGAQADANPFRFSSKYWDGETGFYYYGYRYYSPGMGRWLSRDPIGELGVTTLNKDINRGKAKAIADFISHVRGIDPQAGSRLESRLQARILQLRLEEDGNVFLFAANDPISRYDILGLACGSGLTDIIIRDVPGGVWDFTSCCQGHDNCYGDCKTDKGVCDDEFRNCMLDKCMWNYNASHGCAIVAEAYYTAVDQWGQGPFDKARECCK